MNSLLKTASLIVLFIFISCAKSEDGGAPAPAPVIGSDTGPQATATPSSPPPIASPTDPPSSPASPTATPEPTATPTATPVSEEDPVNQNLCKAYVLSQFETEAAAILTCKDLTN